MGHSNHPPIEIEVTRGDLVESRHLAAAAVVDAAGGVVAAWGDVERPIFGRSAIKPLQALPLVESGAAERFGLGADELAIACGSHGGEPGHVTVVERWLARLGCTVAQLDCGAHAPLHEPAARALAAAGQAPTAAHNNCSGKHTGMLSQAVHLGVPLAGYLDPQHPVQERVRAALEGMTGLELRAAARGIDGCGLPQYALPLRAMAHAMARMADPRGLTAERRAAVLRIRTAMAAAPFQVAGTGRFCTDVMTLAADRVVLKTGAEGTYAAMLPGRGLGLALKILDGSSRARDVACGALLRGLGVLTDAEWAALQPHVAPVLRNHAGTPVGGLRAAAATLQLES